MLSLQHVGGRRRGGLTRRTFLEVGTLGLGALTWPQLIQASAAKQRPRARHCILLFMWGGPAHQDTFDLKPQAPDGIRGEFRPIATRVPGLQICEHLPRLAQRTDRLALLRSVTHTGTNHATSAYHMLTGHLHFRPGPGSVPTPNDYPSIGCAVARFGRQPSDMPAHVALPRVMYEADGRKVAGQDPGVLGQRYAPFVVSGDPTRPDFSVATLSLPAEVDSRRFQQRIQLQALLDQQGEQIAELPAAQDMREHYARVFRLLQSPSAQRALHLAGEPERVRSRYGWHHFGQSCLLARRLIEADVPLVTVYWNTGAAGDPGNWDTHNNNFPRLKNVLLPHFERAYTALLDDLHDRGLLEETLVVWMGEFGRTPRINRQGGRDHWGYCGSVLLAGGGIQGGQVYGSSDAHAAYAAERPVRPDDIAATIFHSLGIRRDQELHDAQGRPLPLCLGTPLLDLF